MKLLFLILIVSTLITGCSDKVQCCVKAMCSIDGNLVWMWEDGRTIERVKADGRCYGIPEVENMTCTCLEGFEERRGKLKGVGGMNVGDKTIIFE